MLWVRDDGGRAAAGFSGVADDCICRAIAIATQTPYRRVHAMLGVTGWVLSLRDGWDHGNAEEGVTREARDLVMERLGWEWQRCEVGTLDDLPFGRIVAKVESHQVAIIDGVAHDTFDSSTQRAPLGYYRKRGGEA